MLGSTESYRGYLVLLGSKETYSGERSRREPGVRGCDSGEWEFEPGRLGLSSRSRGARMAGLRGGRMDMKRWKEDMDGWNKTMADVSKTGLVSEHTGLVKSQHLHVRTVRVHHGQCLNVEPWIFRQA